MVSGIVLACIAGFAFYFAASHSPVNPAKDEDRAARRPTATAPKLQAKEELPASPPTVRLKDDRLATAVVDSPKPGQARKNPKDGLDYVLDSAGGV